MGRQTDRQRVAEEKKEDQEGGSKGEEGLESWRVKIAGVGLWKITVQEQEHGVGEPGRVSFHLVTKDKGAASDGPGFPYSHAGWWMGC